MPAASPNFVFLAKHDDLLVRYAMLAERYVFNARNSSLIEQRQLAEALARKAAALVGAGVYPSDRRRESDVASYNAVATRIAGELGAEIDDLCAAVLEHGPDALWSPDGVHFSDAGSRFLGAQVAREIRGG